MDFHTFCRAHGIILDRIPNDGRWHRVRTESHPHKKNGAVKFLGDMGFVQDWAAQTEPSVWHADETSEGAKIDRAAIERRAKEAAEEIRRGHEAAAKRGAWIMHQCQVAGHPYLAAKGFPDAVGNVWRDEKAGDLKLCIPMRADNRLVGLQTISDQPGFEKRFLYGQRTDQAVFVMGPLDATPVFAEGFATALSIQRALYSLRQPFRLVVCFTAGNLLKVAKNYGRGFIVADHDKPSAQHPEQGGHGIAVARATGLPFWQAPTEGHDANDYEQERGTFALAMQLKPLLMKRHTREAA